MTVLADLQTISVNQLGGLSDDEENTRLLLINQLRQAQKANARQNAYYEGSMRVRDLRISMPPHLRDLEAVTGWPEIIVDVIDERIDWRGWLVEDGDLKTVLDDVYKSNHLGIEVGQSVLDALICGLSFLSVGTGDRDAGEPEVLVKAESPSRATVLWSPRLRRATAGMIELADDRGQISGWTLYFPDRTVTVERQGGRSPVVTNRDDHGLGRVPIAVLRNRPRSSRQDGRSEITRAVRAITDSGVRTLLGAEVQREFYSAPQRWLMGADESMFVGPDGEPRSQWDAVLGHMLSIPRDEDGDIPQVGQFAAGSPTPNVELLRTYAQMISATSGVPATHLGFVQDNPASADAIQRADGRLDKRAIRRTSQFDLGLFELADLSHLWLAGELPPPGQVGSQWTDPSTPTPAASADRAVKLIAAGVFPPESDVTAEQLGLSAQDIARLKVDRRRAQARERVAGLAANAAAARTDPQVADLASRTGTGDPAAAGQQGPPVPAPAA